MLKLLIGIVCFFGVTALFAQTVPTSAVAAPDRSAAYTDSLRTALTQAAAAGHPNDSLLDVYINYLPEDSFSSAATLRFIAGMSPLLDSKANTVLRRDPSLFGKVWMSFPLRDRVRLNGLIIGRSMDKAVQEKNESFASFIAAFARSTYDVTSPAANRAYELNMLRYYERVKDTSKYFPKALDFYDRYYMHLDTDSILRADSLRVLQMTARATQRDSVINGKPVRVASVVFAPLAQQFTAELNHAAWAAYNMTNNPEYIKAATLWVEKGLLVYRSPEALNTYAHLLYIQHQKDRAIALQKEANDLKSRRGTLPKEWDWDLDRMKRGMPLERL